MDSIDGDDGDDDGGAGRWRIVAAAAAAAAAGFVGKSVDHSVEDFSPISFTRSLVARARAHARTHVRTQIPCCRAPTRAVPSRIAGGRKEKKKCRYEIQVARTVDSAAHVV